MTTSWNANSSSTQCKKPNLQEEKNLTSKLMKSMLNYLKTGKVNK